MYAKVVMCPCYSKKFHEEENEYIKKLCRFKCKCQDEHKIFILTCEEHPFIATKFPLVAPKCKCPVLASHEICTFGREVRRLINCKACKFCLKTVPESIQEHIVTAFQCFKRLPCQPFFAWSRESGKVEIYLNNPREPYNIKKTDYFFLFIYDIVIKKISSLITVLLITPQSMYQKTFHGTNAMAL